MDLQTLQFFCTAATEGSLTKAAQKMNYAQSNLSTRMHALEEELGVTLFQRSAGGIRLMPKGEVLFSYARRTVRKICACLHNLFLHSSLRSCSQSIRSASHLR